MNWCGKIADVDPMIRDGLPVFTIVSSRARVEMNTLDIRLLERTAKRLTNPTGRSAVNVDTSRIYIKDINGNEILMGYLVHKNIKTFSPMYDKVGYIET
jgi:hypothetical protein